MRLPQIAKVGVVVVAQQGISNETKLIYEFLRDTVLHSTFKKLSHWSRSKFYKITHALSTM